MTATIWHNPRCSKSRAALALLEATGAAVTVVDYLRDPPGEGEIARLLARAGLHPREALRGCEEGAGALAGADADAIVAAMAADPRLIERPLIETPRGACLARPPERVHAIL